MKYNGKKQVDLKSLKKSLFLVFYWGVDGISSESYKRRVVMVNTVSSLFSIICFLYIPLFLFIGSNFFAILTLLTSISYFVPVLLNRFHRFQFAKIYALLHINIAVFIYSIILGRQFQIQLAFYPAMVLPFLYYQRNQKKQILLFSTLPPSLYFFHHKWIDFFDVIYHFNEFGTSIFGSIMLFVSFICTGIAMWSLNEDARIAESGLKSILETKRHLIAVVCHDIANPLQVSLGTTQMLNINLFNRDGKIKNKDHDWSKVWNYHQRILKAQNMINSIINNVKMMESLERNKASLKLTPISLIEIFEESRFVFAEIAKKNGVVLKYEDKLPPNSKVLAEKVSLSNNVINNIISNAIKFTPKGNSVEITSFSQGDEILIRISDQGIGIPEDLKAKLFLSHEKTSRSGLSGQSGTGFGLPLAKYFVTLFEGTITVESPLFQDQEFKGTAFTVTLKRAGQ